MILHLFCNDKFSADYIERINRLFNPKDHFFVIYPAVSRYCREGDIDCQNVVFWDLLQHRDDLYELFQKSDRIIMHGLYMGLRTIRFVYRIGKKLGKKMIWCVWGGDLYDEYDYNHSLKARLRVVPIFREYYRKKMIGNLYLAVAGCDSAELLKRYKTDAILAGAHYTYRFFPERPLSGGDEMVNVMVGHSATPTCRHLETFDMLRPYAGKIRVFCPLSYPDNADYIEKVNRAGREVFGDDFVPVMDFMEYGEYIQFLNQVDIGVFNNNRQQGMGNITNLLYLGKKVYLSEQNTIQKIYPKSRYAIFMTSDIGGDDFMARLSDGDKKKNRENIEYEYSDEKFKSDWNRIFSDS